MVEACVDGIVVQALGLGNVNRALYHAVADARDAGVPVVIASRSTAGQTRPLYGYEGGGATLAALGAVYAGELSPQKARILLMLSLHNGEDSDTLRRRFD